MTLKELYDKEHPNHKKSFPWYGCPNQYGYAENPEYCGKGNDCCERCWNREVLEKVSEVVKYVAPPYAKSFKELIKLDVEDYCHGCPEFEADTLKNWSEVFIKCKHRHKCKNMYKYLKEKQNEKSE